MAKTLTGVVLMIWVFILYLGYNKFDDVLSFENAAMFDHESERYQKFKLVFKNDFSKTIVYLS